jgi:hypothetical protein
MLILEGDAARVGEWLALRLKNGASLVDWVAVVALALPATLVFVTSSHAQTAALTSADIDAPPAKYDYPYKGDTAISRDLDPAWKMWGWTDVSQVRRGICTIHIVPYGTVDNGEIFDEYALTRVLRHENAHCNGWRHR